MKVIARVACLITSHNRKEKTIKCLDYLFAQKGIITDFLIEVFLVDDASVDGTSESVTNLFNQVNIIQGDGNLYWNRGMHLAWETAASVKDFEYYLWLNDDTFLYDNALQNLIAGAIMTKNESAICGSTFSLECQKISYGGNSIKGELLIPNGKLQEAYSFNGNVVLIPKLVFLEVGNLDQRFPHAIGDFDYGLRIRIAQLRSYILGEFVGTCELNSKLPMWCCKDIPLKKRLTSLYSPLGNSHPYYYFVFELKHYGILVSIKHFISIHLRLLFPKLWLKK